jgi:hypothetical protein
VRTHVKKAARSAPRTIAEAARLASRQPVELHRSIWQTIITPKKGKVRKGPWRKNLTTTTASGYTNAYDWLAKAMGNGPSSAFATAWAWAAAGITISGTSLTNSGASFPTSGQGLAGCVVVAIGLTSQTVRYGVISSNTSTVLTVDQWYDATSTTGASGSTPTTSGGSATTGIAYIILPGQNPAAWMAVTANVFSPSTADTTLAGELTSNGFGRAVGSYSHTAAGSTYVLVHLWTATGTETINNEAQFGAATTTAGGVMPFESAEPSPPTLVSGDTLQNTVTITL